MSGIIPEFFIMFEGIVRSIGPLLSSDIPNLRRNHSVRSILCSLNGYIVMIVSILMTTITAIIIKKIAGLDIFSTLLILLMQLIIGAVVLVFTNNKSVAIINNNILYGYQRRVSQENDNEK